MQLKYIRFALDNLIWIILVAVALFFSIWSDRFFSTPNLINIFLHASVLGILVIGQAFVLITGNFDLSAESVLGFTAMLAAYLMVSKQFGGSGLMVAPALVIPLMLAIGLAVGAFNGFLITKVGMNNFIVTLGMLIVLRGAAFVVNNAQTVYNVPDSFSFLGGGNLGPVPFSVVVVILAFIVAQVIMSYRRFGRFLFAVGGNRDAALASGIDPNRMIMLAYIISGGLAAIAGWMEVGRLGAATAVTGQGLIFEVFAAAVIGGVSLQGGRGSMLGALGGVLLLAEVDTGLNLIRVSPFWVDVMRGMVILVAVFIDTQKVRFRRVEREAELRSVAAAAALGTGLKS